MTPRSRILFVLAFALAIAIPVEGQNTTTTPAPATTTPAPATTTPAPATTTPAPATTTPAPATTTPAPATTTPAPGSNVSIQYTYYSDSQCTSALGNESYAYSVGDACAAYTVPDFGTHSVSMATCNASHASYNVYFQIQPTLLTYGNNSECAETNFTTGMLMAANTVEAPSSCMVMNVSRAGQLVTRWVKVTCDGLPATPAPATTPVEVVDDSTSGASLGADNRFVTGGVAWVLAMAGLVQSRLL